MRLLSLLVEEDKEERWLAHQGMDWKWAISSSGPLLLLVLVLVVGGAWLDDAPILSGFVEKGLGMNLFSAATAAAAASSVYTKAFERRLLVNL